MRERSLSTAVFTLGFSICFFPTSLSVVELSLPEETWNDNSDYARSSRPLDLGKKCFYLDSIEKRLDPSKVPQQVMFHTYLEEKTHETITVVFPI